MPRNLTMYVPLGFVRPDTVTDRYKSLGYAILNDPYANDDEIEPELLPSKLTQPIFANLTLGALSGQGAAKDGCPSVIVFKRVYSNTAPYITSCTLEASLLAFCSARDISKVNQPTPAQALELTRYMSIPIQYGPGVFRDLLERLYSRILHIDSKHSYAGRPGGSGKKTVVDTVMARLRGTGVFDRPDFSAPPSPPLPAATLTPLKFQTPVKSADGAMSPIGPVLDRRGLQVTEPVTPTAPPKGRSTGESGRHFDAVMLPTTPHNIATTHHEQDNMHRLRDIITQESSKRASDDQFLHSQIRTESDIRAAEDRLLNQHIYKESHVRASEVLTLQKMIREEAAVRAQEEQRLKSVQVALEKKQREEEATRAAGDAALEKKIREEIVMRAKEEQRLKSVQVALEKKQREETAIRAKEEQRLKSVQVALEKKQREEAAIRAKEDQRLQNVQVALETKQREEAAIRAQEEQRLKSVQVALETKQREEADIRAKEDQRLQDVQVSLDQAQRSQGDRLKKLEHSEADLWQLVVGFVNRAMGEGQGALETRLAALESTVAKAGGDVVTLNYVLGQVIKAMQAQRKVVG